VTTQINGLSSLTVPYNNYRSLFKTAKKTVALPTIITSRKLTKKTTNLAIFNIFGCI